MDTEKQEMQRFFKKEYGPNSIEVICLLVGTRSTIPSFLTILENRGEKWSVIWFKVF